MSHNRGYCCLLFTLTKIKSCRFDSCFCEDPLFQGDSSDSKKMRVRLIVERGPWPRKLWVRKSPQHLCEREENNLVSEESSGTLVNEASPTNWVSKIHQSTPRPHLIGSNKRKKKLLFLISQQKNQEIFWLNQIFFLPLQSLLNGSGYNFSIGEMVEWSITTVLKTVVPRGTGGSNPSLSAEKTLQNK